MTDPDTSRQIASTFEELAALDADPKFGQSLACLRFLWSAGRTGQALAALQPLVDDVREHLTRALAALSPEEPRGKKRGRPPGKARGPRKKKGGLPAIAPDVIADAGVSAEAALKEALS